MLDPPRAADERFADAPLREAALLLLLREAPPRLAEAERRDVLLPPLREAAARFADPPPREDFFADAFLEDDRLTADDFFDDFLEDFLEDFALELFELRFAADFFAPPLLAPRFFFAPFDALFFAAIFVSPLQKVSGGEPYF